MSAPNAANSTNPPMPMSAMCVTLLETGAPRTIAGSVKIGRASSPPTPRRENAVRPPTAVSESMPATDSIRNWTAAPAAAPAGSRSVIVLPDSWAVITTNHPFVRNAMRWRANVQQKWAISRTTAAANHTRSRLVRRGQAPRTLMMLGRTK